MNEHLSNTQQGNFQVKWIILTFLPRFAENFLYTQNEEEQSPHLKEAPFKYWKWGFSSQIDYSVIFAQFCPRLYAQNQQVSTS